MKLVAFLARIDRNLCNGCRVCSRVCTTLAISMVDKKAVVDPDRCVACGNCEQRCESRAIMLEKLERPRILSVPVDDLPRQ